MILTCDQCQTRYIVPDADLGAEGRQVRCTACNAEWFQEPEEIEEAPPPPPPAEEPADFKSHMEPIPESVKPVPEGEVPVIGNDKGKKKLKKDQAAGYGAALIILLLILGIFAAMPGTMVKVLPSSIVLYDLVGIKTTLDGENLIFDQLKATAEKNEAGIQELTVAANILNLSRNDEKVPYVQVSMIDAGGNIVDSWVVPPEKESLPPNDEFAFRTTYPDIPDTVKEVNVKFIVGKQAAAGKEESGHEEHAGEAPEPERHEEPVQEDAHHDDHGAGHH